MDTGVQFDEEDPITVARPVVAQQKKSAKEGIFTRLAISSGLAKDSHQAQMVLLAVAVGLIIFAVGFYFFNNQAPKKPVNTGSRDEIVNPEPTK